MKAYEGKVMPPLAENMPIVGTLAMFSMIWFGSVHWNSERKAMPQGRGAAVRRDFEKSSRAVELIFAFAD
jgi:hypothetical protein